MLLSVESVLANDKVRTPFLTEYAITNHTRVPHYEANPKQSDINALKSRAAESGINTDKRVANVDPKAVRSSLIPPTPKRGPETLLRERRDSSMRLTL